MSEVVCVSRNQQVAADCAFAGSGFQCEAADGPRSSATTDSVCGRVQSSQGTLVVQRLATWRMAGWRGWNRAATLQEEATPGVGGKDIRIIRLLCSWTSASAEARIHKRKLAWNSNIVSDYKDHTMVGNSCLRARATLECIYQSDQTQAQFRV